MPSVTSSGRPRPVIRLALVAAGLFGGLLLGLAGFELYARLALPDLNVGREPMYSPSPVMPWTLKPGLELSDIRSVRRGEYVYSVHTDARGFRRTGPASSADLAGRGTLMLGDSFVFGMGVQDDETVAARLDNDGALPPCARPVVNGGYTAGYNPATAAAWLADQGPEIAPQQVVHLVFPTNDVSDIRGSRIVRDASGEIARLETPGHYVNEHGYWHERYRVDPFGVRGPLREHFRSYPYLSLLLETWLPALGDTESIVEHDVPTASALLLEALEQAQRWASRRGGSYLVAFLPSLQEVHAGAWAPNAAGLLTAARGRGLAVVDLLGAEPRLVPEHYFPQDQHLTVLGNRVVADQLARVLGPISACDRRGG